jgi:hypothetical protein
VAGGRGGKVRAGGRGRGGTGERENMIELPVGPSRTRSPNITVITRAAVPISHSDHSGPAAMVHVAHEQNVEKAGTYPFFYDRLCVASAAGAGSAVHDALL